MGIRTDLALEEQERLGKEGTAEGVRCRSWETRHIRMSEIRIESDAAALAFHKPVGTYRTMEMNEEQLRSGKETCIEALRDSLIQMIPQKASVLVVGLGNRGVTPDAIGPSVLRRVLVTRHLAGVLPELAGLLRQVCSIAPGVLGETGLETTVSFHPDFGLRDYPGIRRRQQQKGPHPGNTGDPCICHWCPDGLRPAFPDADGETDDRHIGKN